MAWNTTEPDAATNTTIESATPLRSATTTAVPLATAWTVPAALTVATDGARDTNVVPVLDTVLPLALRATTVSATDWPGWNTWKPGVTWSDAGTCVVVRLYVTVMFCGLLV